MTFEDMSIDYANEIYKSRNKTFLGYTVITVDGSTIEIPNIRKIKKFIEKQKHRIHKQVM